MNKFIMPLASTIAVIVVCIIRLPSSASPGPAEVNEQPPKAAAENTGFAVAGRTQCCPGKKAIIAPVPLHPVDEVMVAPGDKVKKAQVLVKLDDDEQQAEVRTKEAMLESAKVLRKEAERYLARAEKLHNEGAMPEASYFAALTTALKAQLDEKAAEAALQSAQAELEHFEVVAYIDGVVVWLNVWPGMVSRPGTSVWGEIMDLSEIDVRIDLTLEQVDRVKVNDVVDVTRQAKKNGSPHTGKVVMVGISVDPTTALVPVVVRVPNADLALRNAEAVSVRFDAAKGK